MGEMMTLEQVRDEIRMAGDADNPAYTRWADAIDAHLTQPAQAVDGWRDIATAPTTGREMILLLTPSRFPQVAYSNTWWTGGFSVECKPTHWMPIAALPKDSNGAEGVEGWSMADFPATCLVHAPTGPVPCCDNHARALLGLYRFLGAHVAVTQASDGDQCINCQNEATQEPPDAAR